MSLSEPSIGGVAAGATFICIVAFCGTAFRYRLWPFNLIFAGGSKHSHAVGHREHRIAPETPIIISEGEALEAAHIYEKESLHNHKTVSDEATQTSSKKHKKQDHDHDLHKNCHEHDKNDHKHEHKHHHHSHKQQTKEEV